jgi:hypothetical protein
MILGLSTTEQFARFTSVRRKIFYDLPQGAAPLTGLTSMLKEETCSDPEFNWWEKRYREQWTITAEAASSKGPFGGSGATTNDSWGTTLRTGGAGIDAGGATVVGEKISIKVADRTQFRVGHIIEMRGAAITGGTFQNLYLRVGQLSATAGWLDCYILNVVSAGLINNASAANTGLYILIIGSSFGQGAVGASSSIPITPINPGNYCQIFRTEYKLTGTAMAAAVKWDGTGPYPDRAKEAAIDHMVEMEKAFLFGTRSKTLETATGYYDTPTYTTGGIMWGLRGWELGSSASGITGEWGWNYRSSASVAAAAWTDDNKRIIDLSSTPLTESIYDTLCERIFRVNNNKANEKLVFCGTGALNIINQLYKSKGVLTADLPMTDTYGMDVRKHVCPFGTLYYKTHPLFSQNPVLRYSMMFVDVGNLVYRYMRGRDTDLLMNRQENNADYRLDEWLTECGLEIRFPETFMFLQNILTYAP